MGDVYRLGYYQLTNQLCSQQRGDLFMPKTTDSVIFSDAEQEILELALQNPELSNSEIADQTGLRLTLVRDTRRQYEADVTLADDVAEQPNDEEPTVDIDTADLSATEHVILELVAENPQITNAEIAEQTGARVALVRDTRDTYGDQIETQPVDEDDTETNPTPSGPGEPSATQQEILTVAAGDPTLSNADIAEQTGARVTLVRDTLDQYDVPSDSAVDGDTATDSDTAADNDTDSAVDSDTDTAVDGDTDGGTDTTADSDTTVDSVDEIDTENWSDAEIRILEAAAENPSATNRDLAKKTWARIPLVRDTLAAYAADDEAATDDSTDGSDDRTDVLEAVDTAAFSGTQLRILETALSNPELTNGEIAEQTDTRITLVRDTLYEHEYDEKPWAGNVDDETDGELDETDEDDEIVVESDTEIEIPDTTASEVFNDRQRAILEAALENPELTNSEIADQTGARLTLVRDTRETYEDGVALAEDDSHDSEQTASTGSSESTTLTEKQKAIIAAADATDEATIAEIAAQTDSRIPLVRDTLASNTVDESETAADTVESKPDDDSASVDNQVDEDDGMSDEMLAAIVILIILHFGILAMLL